MNLRDWLPGTLTGIFCLAVGLLLGWSLFAPTTAMVQHEKNNVDFYRTMADSWKVMYETEKGFRTHAEEIEADLTKKLLAERAWYTACAHDYLVLEGRLKTLSPRGRVQVAGLVDWRTLDLFLEEQKTLDRCKNDLETCQMSKER